MRTAAFIISAALVLLPGRGSEASAQSFTFTAQATSLSDTLGAELVFQGSFTNLSTLPLTLMFVRTLNDLPAGWESSLCFDACYPCWIDTIATTPDFGSSPLQPSETRPFSLHVYPMANAGTGFVRVLALDVRTPADSIGILFTATGLVVSVESPASLPAPPMLEQNYPNPFNPTTTIVYASPAGTFRLGVFDLLGRPVATLASGEQDPGIRSVVFDAAGLPGGVYFCVLTAGRYRETRRMLLLR